MSAEPAITLWAARCVQNPKAQFAARDREHAERMAGRASAPDSGMRGDWEAAEWVGMPQLHAAHLAGFARMFDRS